MVRGLELAAWCGEREVGERELVPVVLLCSGSSDSSAYSPKSRKLNLKGNEIWMTDWT